MFDKKGIARSFDQAAITYDKTAVLQKIVGDRLMSRLDLLKIKPSLILDGGSGTGHTARSLARYYRGSRVAQVDLSTAMLAFSRQRSRRFFSRQYYIGGDIEQLPLRSNSVQLVFSSLAYQWCNNLDLALGEALRVLSGNGLLLFATLGPDTLRELRSSWAQVDGAGHVHPFLDMHDIGDALVRAGFENVVMDVEYITLRYPDGLALMRDLKLVGAHNALAARGRGLTGKNKLQVLLKAYEAFRENNTLPATYEIVYGHGWAPVENRLPVDAHTAYIPASAIKRHKPSP